MGPVDPKVENPGKNTAQCSVGATGPYTLEKKTDQHSMFKNIFVIDNPTLTKKRLTGPLNPEISSHYIYRNSWKF